MKHNWTQSPGDTPCIGFMPHCTRCGISADHEDAHKDCDKSQLDRMKKLEAEFKEWKGKRKP